jgi:hypothetical protein
MICGSPGIHVICSIAAFEASQALALIFFCLPFAFMTGTG